MTYPHMSNLLFAMPMTGRPIWPEVMFAYHSLALPMNWNYNAIRLEGKPIDEARNTFAEMALEFKCKYIFMWDEDVSPPPQTIPELIYKAEHHPEAAAIGGIYCLKRDPAEPLVFRGNGNGPFWDWKAGEFFEVTGIGTGCILIRVEVFKDLKKPWFNTAFNYSKLLDATGGVESWTEDLWWCQRVVDTNKWKIYADASIICGHYDMTTGRCYRLPEDSKPVQHLSVPRGKKKILDLGSGKHPYDTKEGVIVRADSDEKCKPDYRCDLRKLPFATGEYDIVFSSALEQYPQDDVQDLLTEWARVMKPDGEMRLVVSNPEWIAAEMLAGRLTPQQAFSNRKNGFTFGSLAKELKEAGLEVELVKSDPAHIGIRSKRRNPCE